jgi:CDP-glucose 4,6-dehydratase
MEELGMTDVIDSAYAGRRVLVTGHTGFKGSWLALWLHRIGARVTGFSLPQEAGTRSMFHELGLGSSIASVEGDVRNADDVRAVVDEHQPEIVFHLAAQSLVRASYADPAGTYATNVLGTAHVLDAARSCDGLRAVISVTSDKCYENREWLWGYRETDRLGGHDPYSSSKACAELVTSAFAASFFHDDDAPVIASVRAGNVIGGGDWSVDRIVPDLMRAFLADRPARVRRPSAIRPWQHVLEPLAGYMLLGASAIRGDRQCAGGWNFGPEDADTLTVGQLAELAAGIWGSGTLEMGSEDGAVHAAHYLRLDSSKARSLLGYRPRLTIEQAVEHTVDWYRAVELEGADPLQTTHDQLDAYIARAVISAPA